MNRDMPEVVAALCAMSDAELATLIESVNHVPQIAPGLFAWLEHAADWELRRRVNAEIPLQPPEAAIDPSEDEISIAAVLMLQTLFAANAPVVAAFFAAVAGELTGGTLRH
jgi:hypothetical protein